MGTWALPQTKQSAEQLAALMAKPLKASKAEAAIHNLLGDDELSDSIHGQIKTDGSNSDARCLIAARLEDFLDDYADRPEAYSKEWSPSALKICRRIVNNVLTQN
uniref:Uncharacterized protein n=1 Tax=uncultured Alphaproteobacteria bacterium TaxID=91750 RepID=A0A6G8F2I9_9PROT|nr:hypothetical protein PlAlph_3760 [uncultured Alphaproteobacteria bacterium]